MTFNDIIQDSLQQGERVASLSAAHITVTVLVGLLCSLIIYLTYKFFYRGAVYMENFNILNVMMCIITSFVITTIGSNLVLSLGMVGALSIVRFRSAVKDPLDIGFLFWSIAAGITVGAGLFPFAIISCLILAAIYILFTVLATGKKTYILVVKYEESADSKVKEAIAGITNTIKSKSVRNGKVELTLQVKIRKNDADFVNTISALEGVDTAMLVEYTGDAL